jgi:LacI family transcriptional regulator
MGMADPPTAVFATNDYMALGAYEAIIDQGFKIAEEVALVGFNDIEFSAIKGIDLTTIGQKKCEMGAVAVKMLVDRVEGRRTDAVQETILEPELIIRKTCGFHLRGYQRSELEPPREQALDGLRHPVSMEGSR